MRYISRRSFWIIGGAGVGAFIVGNNGKAIKATLRALPRLMRRSKYNKDLYMDLMALLFRLLAKSRQQACCRSSSISIIRKKAKFSLNYPRILADNTWWSSLPTIYG